MTVPDTARPLPRVLQSVEKELRHASWAWQMVRATSIDDDTELRRYVFETECAVKAAAALLDEWFTFGDTAHEDDDGSPF